MAAALATVTAALRLMYEDGPTFKQAPDAVGCSRFVLRRKLDEFTDSIRKRAA